MSFATRARLSALEALSIVYRTSNSMAANSATASIGIPSTVKTGDLMILVVGWSIASGQTLTTPAGWTMQGSQISDESQVASVLLTRVTQAGDQASSVSLPLSAVANISAVLSCYGNVNTASPIDVYGSTAEGSTAVTSHIAPSITLTDRHDWLVSAVVDKANPHTTTWTVPSNITKRTDAYNASNPGVSSAIGDSNKAVGAGATGTKTWTADGSTARAISWSIGIKRGTHVNGGQAQSGSPMLVGAASSSWDTLLAKSGALTVARTYDSGFSTTNLPTFTASGKQMSFYWSNGMTTVHSFKPDIALLAAQDATTMSNLHTLLQSASGKNIWWCIWHEPENNTVGVFNSANTFTYADYVTAWQVFATAVHSYNEPTWKTIWIMMTYSWKQSFLTANPGYTPNSWYPGDSYVDVVGVDDYNEGSLHNNPGDGTPQRWDSPGYGWGDPNVNESQGPNGGGYYTPTLLNWLVLHNKDYAICELGTIRNLASAMGRSKTDGPSGPYTLDWWTALGATNSKADWIKEYSEYHAVTVPGNFSTRCVAMMYFDTGGRVWKGDNTESWELSHTPGDVDYTAWNQVLIDYGS